MFVDDSAMAADLNRIIVVALVRCREPDAAVAVLVGIPGDERGDPLTGLVFGGKGFAGVIRPVFHCPEQQFGVGVVVGHPRS